MYRNRRTTCLEVRGTGNDYARSPTWWPISCAHLSLRMRSRIMLDWKWGEGLAPPFLPDLVWGYCNCLWVKAFPPENMRLPHDTVIKLQACILKNMNIFSLKNLSQLQKQNYYAKQTLYMLYTLKIFLFNKTEIQKEKYVSFISTTQIFFSSFCH